MGMFHIWMISADAAEEVLKGNISYNKYAKSLYALARKCTLAEYRTKAIRKLGARWKRINYRDEKAGEYLEKLTEKGKTAHDRCLAATFCSREKEKEIIHRELAEACREKPEPEWVGWITDENQLLQLFPLVDKDHKLAILFKASDCEKLCGLMEAEKDDDVLDSAARKLASDPMLLRKAMQTTANDSFVRAMLPRIKENDVSMLESLLETGEKRRVRSELLHRIRELSPQVFSEKYAEPYYGILKQEDQLFAIRENRIPQKEIFDTVRWPKWGALAGLLRKEAGFRIHDAESAIALLRTAFDIREFSSNDRDCVEHLAAVAAEDPESLTALMADPQLHIHREAIPIIIGKVTDPALLLKLECASYGVVSNRAGEAREKLAATRQLSVPEFEWQIGGETYIHTLISLLNNGNAPDTAKIAAKHIGEIYRTVPGSRDALSHVRGKNYSLHYDYDEQTCGIHHVDRRETLTTDW